MRDRWRAAAENGWARTALLALFALAAFGPSLFERELMPPDEPRFALVAREMFESGDAIVLTRGGELYTDKPPLLFWGGALAFWLTGSTSEGAARFPSLIASIAVVMLLHRAGRRWFGEPVATRACLIHVSFMLVLQRGAWVATDPLLAPGVFGAVVALTRATEGSRRAALEAAFWLAVALMAKGPVALVFVLLASVAGWLAGAGGPSLRPLLRPGALVVLLLLVLPWPIAVMARLGPETLFDAVWRHNAVRFVSSWDNLKPWWYHASGLVTGLFPWSLALPALLVQGCWRGPWANRRWRWLVLWVALAALFFSIPEGKRGVYLLPVYPAAALIFAAALPALLERRLARAVPAALAALVAAVMIAGAVALALSPTGWGLLPEALDPGPVVTRGAGAVLALMAAALLWFAWGAARGDLRIVYGPAAFAVATGLAFPVLLTPALNEAQAARPFNEQLNAALPADIELGFCRTKWELVAWYGRRSGPVLDRPEDIERFLAGPAPRALICREELLPPPDEWPSGTELVFEGRMSRVDFGVLLLRLGEGELPSRLPARNGGESSGRVPPRGGR